jgi:Xaa-Pro aminopeptidase
MRSCKIPRHEITQRQQRLLGKLTQEGVLILPPTPASIRNGSVHHSYRVDSNIFYLTGFEEAEAWLIVTPQLEDKTHLFVLPKDPEKETWDGFRFGPEGAREHFVVDKTYLIDELPKVLPQLLRGASSVYYRMGRFPATDQKVLQALESYRLSRGRSGLGLLPIVDSYELLGELRVIKSEFEIDVQRRACQASAQAHRALMGYVRPGMTEKEVQGFLQYQFYKNGCSGEGYSSIVASGANACVLHYVFNDRVLKEKELLLVDAGGEYFNQTADITRTYPTDGPWTSKQLEVYEKVLQVQKRLIAMVKPGLTWETLQQTAREWLAEAMLELGLLPGRKEEILSSGDYRKYYPHGIGHYLGLDVHDLGLYVESAQKPEVSRALEPGMILTIEPGLYIPASDSSPYAGIGVRIEDDVLVTAQGCEVLTQDVPKEPQEILAVRGT